MTGINRLTNANVYVNGVDFLGRAEEIELPELSSKMIEHKGLGMWGSPEYPAGLEKMEIAIKWSSVYPEVLGLVYNPLGRVQLMVRADVMQIINGVAADIPLVAMMSVMFSKGPKIGIKKHENAEVPTTAAVYAYSLTMGGVPIVNVDVEANILEVAGEDVLANFRAIQGS